MKSSLKVSINIILNCRILSSMTSNAWLVDTLAYVYI